MGNKELKAIIMTSHLLEQSGLSPDCSKYAFIHDILFNNYMKMDDNILEKILSDNCKIYV